MSYITAADGAQIFYTDWGEGRPVVLRHGWPLDADLLAFLQEVAS